MVVVVHGDVGDVDIARLLGTQAVFPAQPSSKLPQFVLGRRAGRLRERRVGGLRAGGGKGTPRMRPAGPAGKEESAGPFLARTRDDAGHGSDALIHDPAADRWNPRTSATRSRLHDPVRTFRPLLSGVPEYEVRVPGPADGQGYIMGSVCRNEVQMSRLRPRVV